MKRKLFHDKTKFNQYLSNNQVLQKTLEGVSDPRQQPRTGNSDFPHPSYTSWSSCRGYTARNLLSLPIPTSLHPEPIDLSTGGQEHLNQEEVEKIDFRKMFDTLKQHVKKCPYRNG